LSKLIEILEVLFRGGKRAAPDTSFDVDDYKIRESKKKRETRESKKIGITR
jgi:hypothetical protein